MGKDSVHKFGCFLCSQRNQHTYRLFVVTEGCSGFESPIRLKSPVIALSQPAKSRALTLADYRKRASKPGNSSLNASELIPLSTASSAIQKITFSNDSATLLKTTDQLPSLVQKKRQDDPLKKQKDMPLPLRVPPNVLLSLSKTSKIPGPRPSMKSHQPEITNVTQQQKPLTQLPRQQEIIVETTSEACRQSGTPSAVPKPLHGTVQKLPSKKAACVKESQPLNLPKQTLPQQVPGIPNLSAANQKNPARPVSQESSAMRVARQRSNELPKEFSVTIPVDGRKDGSKDLLVRVPSTTSTIRKLQRVSHGECILATAITNQLLIMIDHCYLVSCTKQMICSVFVLIFNVSVVL